MTKLRILKEKGITHRMCNRCGVNKPLEDYFIEKDSQGDKCIKGKCKKCRIDMKRIRRNRTPEIRESYLKKDREYNRRPETRKRVAKIKRKRIKRDKIFKLKINLMGRLNNYLKSSNKKLMKTNKTYPIVGLKPDELREHLNKTFLDNYGFTIEYNKKTLNIDHIVPLSTAKTKEDIIKLFHYTNLQYLTREDNRKKHNKNNYK